LHIAATAHQPAFDALESCLVLVLKVHQDSGCTVYRLSSLGLLSLHSRPRNEESLVFSQPNTWVSRLDFESGLLSLTEKIPFSRYAPSCIVPLTREQKVADVCQNRPSSPSVERYLSILMNFCRTMNLYGFQLVSMVERGTLP
jgi:hypothetical protein